MWSGASASQSFAGSRVRNCSPRRTIRPFAVAALGCTMTYEQPRQPPRLICNRSQLPAVDSQFAHVVMEMGQAPCWARRPSEKAVHTLRHSPPFKAKV